MDTIKARDLRPGMVIQTDDGPATVLRVDPGFIRYDSGPAKLIVFTGGWCHKPVDADIVVETP